MYTIFFFILNVPFYLYYNDILKWNTRFRLIFQIQFSNQSKCHKNNEYFKIRLIKAILTVYYVSLVTGNNAWKILSLLPFFYLFLFILFWVVYLGSLKNLGGLLSLPYFYNHDFSMMKTENQLNILFSIQ